jgi:ABC-type Fe3+/spermidine/putrescine transport system ATPase subunit
MSSVRVLGVTKRFGAVTAAYEVSFDVASGATLALLGPSGCGKTTILRGLAGLEAPDWGAIEIDGVTLFDRTRGIDVPAERRGLGYVPRSYAVWPHLSVGENVAFPLRVRGVGARERLERASRMLELVELKGVENQPAAMVTTAQLQRIAVARALIHEPRLVLFDEPFANLDPGLRQQARATLRGLRDRLGFTAIYATYDPAEAFILADHVILLNQGAVEMNGPAREVYQRPRTGFAARFFGMNVLEGRLLGPTADERYLEVELSARLVVRGVAAPDAEFSLGGRILACIPKQAVRVLRPRDGEPAAGVIAAVSFLGSEDEYLIDIAGVMIEAIGPPIGLAKGDRVNVAMTPDDWVFAR